MRVTLPVASDANDRAVAVSRVAVVYDEPAANRFELPVSRFHEMVRAAVEGVGVDRGRVSEVSFSTQANTFFCCDASGRAVTPMILWHDGRAGREMLEPLGALPSFTSRTGMPDVYGQTMPAKARWLQRERPEAWGRTASIRFIGDELAHLLTGRCVTEPRYAGLSGLMDIHEASWWPRACRAVGVEAGMLGEPVRAGTDLGPIALGAAEALGLPGSCRVTMGCLDQYAGAVGTGATGPGRVSATLGAVLAVVRCTESPDAEPGVFVDPAWRPGLYFHMVFGITSANLLEHYRSTLPGRPSFAELDALAAASRVPDDLVIHRVEEGQPLARSFDAVHEHHTPGEVTRAILRLAADTLRDQVRTLCGRAIPEEIHLAGGGARSELWRTILSERVGRRVVDTPCDERTCLGAAKLRSLRKAAAPA